ncbi:Uncharacterised protein [Mycobacteroides abscessus subsp. abscessus]|nr:Uncharacterised protein [Mycobacteroides abscessus subsp. abscessus]
MSMTYSPSPSSCQNRKSGCINWNLPPTSYGIASACCPDDGFRYQPTSVVGLSSDSSTAASHDEPEVSTGNSPAFGFPSGIT